MRANYRQWQRGNREKWDESRVAGLKTLSIEKRPTCLRQIHTFRPAAG